MTPEQLKKANDISCKIKEVEDFQKAFNAPYVNYIRAADFRGDKECDQFITISTGDELHKLINDYISNQLEKLKKEFAEL